MKIDVEDRLLAQRCDDVGVCGRGFSQMKFVMLGLRGRGKMQMGKEAIVS